MKVEIRNLGVIKNAEIDLKPLTVFIGRNGTGKTWAACTLASILGKYGFNKYRQSYINGKINDEYPCLDKAIKQFLEEGRTQINLIEFAEKNLESYINNVSKVSPVWMQTFLNTERVSFDNLEVNVTLTSNQKDEIIRKITNSSVSVEISFGFRKKDLDIEKGLRASKEENSHIIDFYAVSKGDIEKKSTFPQPELKKFIVETIFQILHKSFYPYIYIFPTERTAFVSFLFSVTRQERLALSREDDGEELNNSVNNASFELKDNPNDGDVIKEDETNSKNNITSTEDILSELKSLLKKIKNSELPSNDSPNKRRTGRHYPIISLTEVIALASVKTSIERQEEIQKDSIIQKYIELADILEKDILSGNVTIDSSTPQNQIVFQASEDINLEMQVASSMVKELAPIALCLRHLVQPGELLIIDEPEMNLHPAAQVEIIEFLAMLVNTGLNILITTHSTYIVDHLVNLMKAAKRDDKDIIQEKFYLENKEAFISQDNVSVYLFDDGTAKNILSEEGQIDWSSFSDISDDIANILI